MGSEMKSYKWAIISEMFRDIFHSYQDNWDDAQGKEPPETLLSIFMPIVKPLTKYKELKGVEHLYNILEDDESRSLLIKILAYRYMGHRKVKLPRNNPERQNNLETMNALDKIGQPLQIASMNLELNQYDLSGVGYHFNSYCTARGGSYIFLQRQYEFNRGGVVCKAEEGDIVIDAGACWGETTLYFADAVGDKGRVVAFEFIPSNAEVLHKNIEANPDFKDRITVVDRPLWDVEDQELFYVDWGPGSRVSFEKMRDDFPDDKCWTTTIDAVVEKYELPSVDFIKMDIEGAEPSALEGARNTIRKFHPKLAISLYHHINDFKTVPAFIESTGMKYKYYLDHHTIFQNETVLFAVPEH